MESLIKSLEKQIADNLKFLQSVSWGSHTIGQKPSDRGSPDFIDKITTILVLQYGFAEGMRLAFEVKCYLE